MMRAEVGNEKAFSAALCRGLIEASRIGPMISAIVRVFRGFMPRPH